MSALTDVTQRDRASVVDLLARAQSARTAAMTLSQSIQQAKIGVVTTFERARDLRIWSDLDAMPIDRIKDVPYGQLTLAVTGGDMEAAFARFKAADVHMEVLR